MKVAIFLLGCCCFVFTKTQAQEAKKLIKEGNAAYHKEAYETATQQYQQAIAKDTANGEAIYNLGNAFYKAGNKEAALEQYEQAIKKLAAPQNKGKAYYNKGVILQNQQKLPECIEAYKMALRLNQNDEDARHNLQKALQQQKEQNKKKEEEKKKDKKNKDNKPKPQPSKLTRKEAEEKLNALLQQEKKLQDKLHKSTAESPLKPEKDW